MEIDTTINISILISACLAIIGWMVNNYFKRRHEIAKKRLEYRLETLHSMIQADEYLQKNNKLDDNVLKQINIASINFQLYGYQDEIDILNL